MLAKAGHFGKYQRVTFSYEQVSDSAQGYLLPFFSLSSLASFSSLSCLILAASA